MSAFLSNEKPKQAAFKNSSPYFSSLARDEGKYKDHIYPFCIPREFSYENLYPGIRQPIKSYFSRNEIKWHDGQDGNPSNHMCDSQVCCVNFLFPFGDKPKALIALLKPIFPDIQEILPIEDDLYVAFEWIGRENYLGEIKSDNRKRTRGANFTSADAAIMFRRSDNRKQIVLIEWKYTESYYPTFLKFAASGRDRTKLYEYLYFANDCPLNKELISEYDNLFYEPFYQLMRQQFLAHELEKARELGANFVSLLHLSPAHNIDFKRVTSPGLRTLDNSAIGVWKKIVNVPDKFTGEYIENIFGQFDINSFPELEGWWRYITMRYSWVIEGSNP